MVHARRIGEKLSMKDMTLTAVSFAFLPDGVRIQSSAYTGTSTDVPKLWGITLAALLSVGGVVGVLLSRKPESQKCGLLVISVIGFILFAYMFMATGRYKPCPAGA